MFIIAIYIFFYASYFIFVLILKSAWQKIKNVEFEQKNSFANKISVVVAYKNESQNLKQLLQSLENQSISTDLVEIIFINDHSTDYSLEIIEQHCKASKFKISVLNGTQNGKKNAIAQAVSFAKNEIILCTDADCVVSKDWLITWLHFFENEKLNLGFGLVTFKENNTFFTAINTIEFASLVGSGAATWAKKMPTMCNGANIAYRKSIFMSLNGFEGINNQPSGDDELLMHKIYKAYPDSVAFLKSKSAIVETKSATTFKEFYNQRLRWASKWENYQLPHVKAIAMFVFFINAITLCGFFDLIINFSELKLVLFFIFQLIRMLLEFSFLHSILQFMDKKLNLTAFLFLFLIYPFYVVFFGLGGRFLGYDWKKIDKK